MTNKKLSTESRKSKSKKPDFGALDLSGTQTTDEALKEMLDGLSDPAWNGNDDEPVVNAEEAAAPVGSMPVIESAPTPEEVLESAVNAAEAVSDALAHAESSDKPDSSAPSAATMSVIAGGEDKPAKVPRAPRKHYTNKFDRLVDRVGSETLAEYSMLTTADAAAASVDADAMKTSVARTMDIIKAMNQKEQNRASNFMEFVTGKRKNLNTVLERVLRVAERDGFVTTGNEGNVFKDLLSRPYSPASARAMGGNTIAMFKDLLVLIPVAGNKGRYVLNDQSVLYSVAKSLLDAQDNAAAAAAAEK